MNTSFTVLEHISVDDGDKCWPWTRPLDTYGYGQLYVAGRMRKAHRLVFEITRGSILEDTLDHTCRNRACCNPWHLDPKSIAENVKCGEGLAAQRAKQTTCIRGHELEVRKCTGRRWCRTCARERDRVYRSKK